MWAESWADVGRSLRLAPSGTGAVRRRRCMTSTTSRTSRTTCARTSRRCSRQPQHVATAAQHLATAAQHPCYRRRCNATERPALGHRGCGRFTLGQTSRLTAAVSTSRGSARKLNRARPPARRESRRVGLGAPGTVQRTWARLVPDTSGAWHTVSVVQTVAVTNRPPNPMRRTRGQPGATSIGRCR
jgi:hypothetical protein